MEKFPIIETDRLRLSKPEVADIPSIVLFAGNPKVSAFTLNLPFPYVESDAVYWINMANQGFKKRNQFIFAIREKDGGNFLGGIGLTITENARRGELGYWLAESYWNRGMITEAVNAMIHFGFKQLGLNKITACYFKDNVASGRVMQKSGMMMEGELKDHIFKNDVFHTLVLYGLTHADYSGK